LIEEIQKNKLVGFNILLLKIYTEKGSMSDTWDMFTLPSEIPNSGLFLAPFNPVHEPPQFLFFSSWFDFSCSTDMVLNSPHDPKNMTAIETSESSNFVVDKTQVQALLEYLCSIEMVARVIKNIIRDLWRTISGTNPSTCTPILSLPCSLEPYGSGPREFCDKNFHFLRFSISSFF
jgi:hypothetical protein